MSKFDWGYKEAQRMLNAKPDRVTVKSHTRAYAAGGAVKKAEGGGVKPSRENIDDARRTLKYVSKEGSEALSRILTGKDEKGYRSSSGNVDPWAQRQANFLQKKIIEKYGDDVHDKKNARYRPPGEKSQNYAKGGPVKKSDASQDKALMARHNRLMHPGQKSKLAHGGSVKKKGC